MIAQESMHGDGISSNDRIADVSSEFREPTFLRYPCGLMLGLALAGVSVSCSVPFVDGWLMHNMEYGPNDLLQDSVVIFGLTAPDLLSWLWVGLLIGMPLAAVIAQHKPLLPALDSWKALVIGSMGAIASLVLAITLVMANVFYWAFLYI